MPFFISELSGGFELKPLNASHPSRVSVTALCSDSREVSTGALFVALSGVNESGAAFVADAVKRGAGAIVTDNPEAVLGSAIPVPTFSCENARHFFSIACNNLHGRPTDSLTNIAVTGTNGKTTTSWLISGAFEFLDGPCVRVGTLGMELPMSSGGGSEFRRKTLTTTPSPDEFFPFLSKAVEMGAIACSVEMSSHALDQGRLFGVDWDVAVFGNLSRDHLDYHSSLEDYAGAKTRLFTEELLSSKRERRTAVLNLDDEWGRRIKDDIERTNSSIRVIGFSTSGRKGADAKLLDFELALDGTRFVADVCKRVLSFETRLIGRYNLENALSAVACLVALGYEPNSVSEALSGVDPVPGRLEVVWSEGPCVLVDYAHTPDALVRALESLREIVSGHIRCVFGCGGDRDRGKRPLMARAVSEGADSAIITSDNPRSESPEDIIEEIRSGIDKGRLASAFSYEVVVDRREAIRLAIESAKRDDVILIAGKGHEDYQEVMGVRHHFSDREVCLDVLACDKRG